MPVTHSRAGFHRRKTPHAAILLVEFTADFHHLSWRFRTTGKQAAADDRVGEGQRLDNVAGFGDAPVGDDGHALLLRRARADVKRGELRHADTRHDAGGAN